MQDRHVVIPLSDEEHKSVKQLALNADISRKRWLRLAVVEKINKEKE